MNSTVTVKAPTNPGSTAAYTAVANGTNLLCRFKEGSISPITMGDGSGEYSFRYPEFFFDQAVAVVWTTDQRIVFGVRQFQVLKWSANDTYSYDTKVWAVEVQGLD